MRLKALFILLLISQLGSSQDCNYTFLGELKDFHNNSPIVGATIYMQNLDKYTTSDVDGKFKIEKLCKGELTLVISHVGCETKTITYNIESDIFKSIALEHHIEELTEVTVAGSSKLEKTSIQQTVSKSDIENYTDRSLGDALTTVSGVSTLNTGNSIVKPMIHGLHSSRLLIINNNVRMFDQEWGEEHAPNVDINSGGRIEVIKGANTLMHGSDAIGGIVLIRPENFIAKDSIFGSTSLSLNSNGLGGNANTELIKTYESGFYAKAQASYKRFGDFKASDYNLSNSGIKSINASARIGYKSFEKGFDAYYSYVDNTIGIIRAAHVGNVNDLVRAINRQEPAYISDFSHTIENPRQAIIHHLGKVEAYKRFKGLGKLSLQYDFQINRRKEFDRRRAGLNELPAADFRLFTTSLQPNLKIDAFDNLIINTGFLLRYQQNSSADQESTGISIPLIPDYDKYETGIYTIANYDIDTRTSVSAGFRYDYAKIEAEKKYKVFDWEENNYDELYPEFSSGIVEDFEILTFPEFSFHNISANLGLTRSFNNNHELLFNYGLASRMPNVSELFSDGLHHSAARIEIGDLTLTKEVAHKFLLSFERNNENFGFSISPYYRYINDFIQLIPGGEASTTIRGAFIEWQYDQVNAQIFGVDVDVNKRLTDNFNYKGSLSLLRGDNLTDNVPLIHMPSTNFSNSITYSNKSLNELTVGITQYTELRQNRFPDYNFTTFNPITQEDTYVDISSPTDAFTLFHFNSSATFKVFKKSKLNVAFNINNMFNVSYRNYLNRLRYFADDVGRNFNIKLKLNY
ncbi:TonB-dependent receptor [Winogradskyella poriferorum]|uniref:TonB-dependent receptor n=1 Tax=Winogradskyella poriferorum TaxID=307627 RepID=A0ABU7W4R8_9FLAO